MGWLEASVRQITSRFDTSIVETPQMAAVFSALANAFLATLPVFVFPNPQSGGHNGEDVKYVCNFIIVIDMHKSYIKRKYLIIL